MQVERPSLSSSPSLSAYVHDHPSVDVRSCSHCSDEPTTRSESDSDQQQQQGRREGEQEAAENENESNDNSGGGFEFSFDCAEAMSSPISADQVFHNGRMKLTVPIYEVARVYPEQEDRKSTGVVDDPRLKVAVEKMIQKTSRRKALRRLFMEEKEKYSYAPNSISFSTSASASTSSSETDEATENASNNSELESVPSDTYCVWKPKTSSDSNPNEISKKSEPLSKRWKLKDLLTRNSTSEKLDSSQISSSSSSDNNSNKNEKEVRAAPQLARKMAMKEGGERRKSYLPYRQELVGIFGSSGSGRNLQRF